MVYETYRVCQKMWWFLIYYVVMQVPSGVVETSFENGVLQVGDTLEYVGNRDLVCAIKRDNKLIFKFDELTEINVFSF